METGAEEYSEYSAQVVTELLCLCESPEGLPLVEMSERALCATI